MLTDLLAGKGSVVKTVTAWVSLSIWAVGAVGLICSDGSFRRYFRHISTVTLQPLLDKQERYACLFLWTMTALKCLFDLFMRLSILLLQNIFKKKIEITFFPTNHLHLLAASLRLAPTRATSPRLSTSSSSRLWASSRPTNTPSLRWLTQPFFWLMSSFFCQPNGSVFLKMD